MIEDNKKNNFIEFLKQEFGFSKTNFLSVNEIIVAKPQKSKEKKLRWSSLSQSRDLSKVLDIKMLDEDEVSMPDDVDSIDLDDAGADSWQKEIRNLKGALPVTKKSFFNFKNIFVNIFAQPLSNVPGILSYCREEEPEEKLPPLGFKYLSLIIIVFIASAYCVVLFPKETKQLARFNERILVESWYGNKKANSAQNIAAEVNVNTDDLANFIRTNADKIKFSPEDKKSFVLLSQDDILGRPAAAEEQNNNIKTESVDNWLVKIGNKETELINSAITFLYWLSEKQKDFSVYLSRALADVLEK